MSKDNLSLALDRFQPYKGQDAVLRFKEVMAARLETLRDRLEKEESEQVRGQCKELRELFKLLNE